MNKQNKLNVFIFLLFINFLFLASASTINVCSSCEFDSIQDAINNASNNDVLNVNGIFHENVIINKSLTLIGNNGILECSNGIGFLAESQNVIIKNFTIEDCNIGIRVENSGNTINENTFINNNLAAEFEVADNNLFNYNKLTGQEIENLDINELNAESNYWGECDGPETWQINGNVDYTPWIGICINGINPQGCIIENQNITLNAEVIGEASSVIFSVNDINVTGARGLGNLYNANIQISGNGDTQWKVYAYDEFGNIFESNEMEFYLTKSTELEISPEQPNGENNWFITEPSLRLNADNSAISSFYMWAGSNEVHEYNGEFGLEDIPNAPPIESGGILTLKYWSQFQCGNESEKIKIINVDLSDPVIKNLKPSDNSIIYLNTRPEIYAFIDEKWHGNSGINLTGVRLEIDNEIVNANITKVGLQDAEIKYIPDYDLSSGLHEVYLYAEDNAGRKSEKTWSFSIFSVPFELNVYMPINGNSSTKKIKFNISSTEEVAELGYINYNDRNPRFRKLCRECTSYGFERIKTENFNEGENNITIRAINLFGNIQERNLSIYVDSKLPKVSEILPKKNSFFNGSGFFIRYVEENLKRLILYLPDNAENLNCSAGTNIICISNINLSRYNGQKINYFYELDDGINTARTRNISIFVDSSAPEITINKPRNITYFERLIFFNITSNEAVKLEYKDEFNDIGRWKRLCNNCIEYGNLRKKTIIFSSGNHKLLIKATDLAGNSKVEEIEFSVV